MRTVLFWLALPLRVFLHFWRFVFGHPVPFAAVFAALAVLFFYLSTLQTMPDAEATASGNASAATRLVSAFPAANTLGALCAMVVGALLIWIAEHKDKPIRTWTTAPSIWRPVGAEPIVDLESEGDRAT